MPSKKAVVDVLVSGDLHVVKSCNNLRVIENDVVVNVVVMLIVPKENRLRNVELVLNLPVVMLDLVKDLLVVVNENDVYQVDQNVELIDRVELDRVEGEELLHYVLVVTLVKVRVNVD